MAICKARISRKEATFVIFHCKYKPVPCGLRLVILIDYEVSSFVRTTFQTEMELCTCTAPKARKFFFLNFSGTSGVEIFVSDD